MNFFSLPFQYKMSDSKTISLKISKSPGKLRVGKIQGKNFPTYPGFTQIIVKTKSDGSYWQLSPYYTKCTIPGTTQKGIMENCWQNSKIYQTVKKQNQRAKWNSNLIIWEYPEEQHIDSSGNILPAYLKWRMKLATNEYAVRYPNGYNGRHECICSLLPDENGALIPVSGPNGQKATKEERYIAARKAIYCPLYAESVGELKEFKELQTRLNSGENLLILDVDGPSKTEKYPFHFVEDGSIAINEELTKAMLNDSSQPFGHGAVLSVLLLNKEEWLK